MNIVAWLRGKYWDPGTRAQVIGDYASVRQMPRLIADVAHRGCVFTIPQPPPKDLFEAGVVEGRRQMALEFMRLADADTALLQKLCFEPMKKEG